MTGLKHQVRKMLPERLRPLVGGVRRRVVANPLRIGWQRGRLVKSGRLKEHQLERVNQVSMRIHHRDGMYSGNASQYFQAGLSAVECIDEVLANVTTAAIKSVLDLPSGYGRELRFLVQRFPDATLTACDIQWDAVDFCVTAFGAIPAYSKPDISDMSFDRRFDLIWSGSLVTHLDRKATLDLLKLFSRHLSPGGVMIVTTNGDFVADQMRGGATYDLPADAIPDLVSAYDEAGYAYRDYDRGLGYFEFHPEERGYGVSITSPETIRSLAREEGNLEEVYFQEQGWANHQDVFAFRRKVSR